MPHPPVYTGGQDDDRTRSIDVVHIEPSIREGTMLVSSLYGTEASAPLWRYAPTNSAIPFITGEVVIPSTIECFPGTWDASPAALFEYQWKLEGVDLVGATDKTYTTSPGQQDLNFTCVVRGYNYLGELFVESGAFVPELLESIQVLDDDFTIITGLSDSDSVTNRDERLVITTGISAEDRMDLMRAVAYIHTGSGADGRDDTQAMYFGAIYGIDREQTVMSRMTGVAAISWDIGGPLLAGESQPLYIKNHNAELGMGGWEIFGATDFQSLSEYDFNLAWWGGENVDVGQLDIPYSYMWQDVPIWPLWQADVDAGSCSIYIEFYQSSKEWLDYANVRVEFLNGVGGIISSDNGPGLTATREEFFTLRSFETAVPPLTREIRIVPEFSLQEGQDNNGYIDHIRGEIYLGSRSVDRSFGPDFKQWRISFTRQNTYSGCALSELEFRDGIGGADLATGGTVVSGSEGLSGLATYAFDDLRDANYWAGEINAVATGSSWIGYSKAATYRPVEIDITARTGIESLQVGRDFMLQGRDEDTELWRDVQFYEDIPEFTSGEQKQFVVADGAVVYTLEDTQTASGSTVREYTGVVTPHKGNIYEARTRMDISHLRGYFQAAGIDGRLSICKIQYPASFPNGVLFDVGSMRYADFTTVGAGYQEVALSFDFEVEVGDVFVVFATDLNNPTPNICRVANFTVPFAAADENTFYAKIQRSFGHSNMSVVEGSENTYGTTERFDVDFRGTIF